MQATEKTQGNAKSHGWLLLGAVVMVALDLTGEPRPILPGSLLSGAGRQVMEQVRTLALFPGLAVSRAALAVNLFGDMLRDILDPRLCGDSE
jgi:peptide/nickel transport system permease protein